MNTALQVAEVVLLLIILCLGYYKMSQLEDEVQQLQQDVAAENTVIDSAVVLINGFAGKLQAAIDAAIAAGATPQQLQNLTDLHNTVTAKSAELAAAVAATPSA